MLIAVTAFFKASSVPERATMRQSVSQLNERKVKMAENAGNIVKQRGDWTCVQKVKSGRKSFYVNVICHGEPPANAVELAGGVCGKARCTSKPVCFRQIKFKDGHRGYEFSCARHKDVLVEEKKAKKR